MSEIYSGDTGADVPDAIPSIRMYISQEFPQCIPLIQA